MVISYFVHNTSLSLSWISLNIYIYMILCVCVLLATLSYYIRRQKKNKTLNKISPQTSLNVRCIYLSRIWQFFLRLREDAAQTDRHILRHIEFSWLRRNINVCAESLFEVGILPGCFHNEIRKTSDFSVTAYTIDF